MTVKGLALLPRRPDIPAEHFHEHWRTVHRELALRITTTRRYVQLHRTGDALPGFPPAEVDGVAETWVDDLDTLLARRHDPAYVEHAGRDEPAFIDVPRIRRLRVAEDVRRPGAPIGPRTPLVKGVIFLTGTGDDFGPWFASAWLEAVAALLPGVVREVQCTPLVAGDYDGVTELWWRNEAHLAADGPALRALAAEASVGPVDLGASASLVGTELRVIWPDR